MIWQMLSLVYFNTAVRIVNLLVLNGSEKACQVRGMA